MAEQYFPEFKFTEPEFRIEDAIKLTFIGDNQHSARRQVLEEIVFDELTDESYPYDIGDIGVFQFSLVPPSVKSVDEIMPEFEATLHRIGRVLGHELTMQGRELLVVDKRELIPKTREGVDALVQRYGAHILNGIDGDCKLLDGTYRLRVGISHKPGVSTKPVVLDIAAHEYGHTLGSGFLESAMFEELKAYAFASLFLKFYQNSRQYRRKRTDLHPDRPHDVAIHRLGELLRAGILEGAVISHLTGTKFGKYAPESYIHQLRFAQSLRGA